MGGDVDTRCFVHDRGAMLVSFYWRRRLDEVSRVAWHIHAVRLSLLNLKLERTPATLPVLILFFDGVVFWMN